MYVGNMVIPAHASFGMRSYYQRVVKCGIPLTKYLHFDKVQRKCIFTEIKYIIKHVYTGSIKYRKLNGQDRKSVV